VSRQLVLVLLAACLAACAGRGRIGGPPPIFPTTTVWTVPLGGLPLGPLVSDGSRIFVSSRDGTVRALDRLTGSLLWELPDRGGFLAARPGVLVLCQQDGTVWRLEPESGATEWQTRTSVTGAFPPALNDDRVIVAGDGIVALALTDGEPLWSRPETASSWPAAHGRWVLVGEEGGALRCRDGGTGASLWVAETGSSLRAPALVDEKGRVLLGTTAQRFTALDVTREGRERWRWKLGADVTSRAAVLGDKVLFTSLDNVLYALKRGNGHLVWRAPLPSRPISGPVLVGSAVLVACHEQEILGFDGRTGDRLGSLKTPTELKTPPLVLERWIFVGLRNPAAVAALSLASLEPPQEEAKGAGTRRLPTHRKVPEGPDGR
jgi:outer membrane protein assembly factor BamB